MSEFLSIQGVVKDYSSRTGIVGKRRKVRALDQVSVSMKPGEVLGVVGESGSGKSTLGRIALGLEEPSAGTVKFDGTSLPAEGTAEWRRLRRRMQMVYQNPLDALDRRLTAIDQVMEPLIIHGETDKAAIYAKARDMLATVGLDENLASRYPHELSGGQRQRVVIARALMLEPDLLVCDEAVSALDVSIQAQIVNLLVSLRHSMNLSMIFISHDLRVVRFISDRVAVLYLGNVVEEGSANDIFERPLHPYTQALVSSIPSLGAKSVTRITLEGEIPNPSARPSGCVFHPRCRMATAVCKEKAPVMTHLEDGSRRVSCHLVSGPER